MPPSIALCTRELHPFIGGGIAPIVRALSDELAEGADVTLVTTAAHRPRYEELVAAGDPVFDPRVRVVFVEEPPPGPGMFYSWLHAWSAALYEGLVAAFPDGGPDLAEFPDYLAEGFVTTQAKRTADPRLRRTAVATRLHTSVEMVHVLNGHLEQSREMQAVYDMERYCLRQSDLLLWPGGDVHATYARFYGRENLARRAVEIPDAFLIEREPTAAPVLHDGPLKLLYLGRMERRKGVQNLVRALIACEYEDWTLTMVGSDTPTAPLGVSMRGQLTMMTFRDDRFQLLEPVPRADVGSIIDAHDAVVIPSLWECWPNTAREALLHNRPVIATPVGGLTAFVEPGKSGFLAADTSQWALTRLLEPLVRDPSLVRALTASGTPRRSLARHTDVQMIRDRYARLHAAPARQRRRPDRTPLVSVIVPYFRLEDYVEQTVASVAAQDYGNIETIVVNDGSLRDEDRILDGLDVRVVTQRNRGLGAARNLGVLAARGRFVLPLDADDLIEPDFVSSTVAALTADDDLAYVGTWSIYVDDDNEPLEDGGGYAPLGNWSRLTEVENVAGSASALIRRHVFDIGFAYSRDLTSYEDWLFYLQLRRAGHFGGIIPRQLLRYRIRGDSMLRSTGMTNLQRLQGEVAALAAEGGTQWTSQSA